MLRQKTLLGETYVELTPGTSEKTIPEDGQAARRAGQADRPARRDLRLAGPADARGVPRLAEGPGQGHQGPRPRLQRRARHAARLRPRRRRRARGARHAGGRGPAPRQEHRRGVRGADRERGAAAQPDHRLQAHASTRPRPRTTSSPRRSGSSRPSCDESKLDARPRAAFSTDTRPADQRPAAGRPRPAADAARRARARARTSSASSRDLDPVITASKTGMPATREVLAGAQPLLGELGPFLQQINPIFKYFEASQWQVADFLNYGAAALAAKTELARRRRRPLPAPVRPARRRERRDLAGARADQPRQLLLPAAQHRRIAGGRRPGLRPVQDHGPVRLHATPACEPAPTDGQPGCVVQSQNPFDPGTSSRSTASSCRAPSRTSRPTTTRRAPPRAATPSSGPRPSGRGGGAAHAGVREAVEQRRRRAGGGRVNCSSPASPSGPSALHPGGRRAADARVRLGLGRGALGDLDAAAAQRELVAALGQRRRRASTTSSTVPLEPVGRRRASRARAGRSRRR